MYKSSMKVIEYLGKVIKHFWLLSSRLCISENIHNKLLPTHRRASLLSFCFRICSRSAISPDGLSLKTSPFCLLYLWGIFFLANLPTSRSNLYLHRPFQLVSSSSSIYKSSTHLCIEVASPRPALFFHSYSSQNFHYSGYISSMRSPQIPALQALTCIQISPS